MASRMKTSPFNLTLGKQASSPHQFLSQTTRPHLSSPKSNPNFSSSHSSSGSLDWSETSSDSEAPLTPVTDPTVDAVDSEHIVAFDVTRRKDHKATTQLLTQDSQFIQEQTQDNESGARLIQKYCCGGGCCLSAKPDLQSPVDDSAPLVLPSNEAFGALKLKLKQLSRNTALTNTTPLPPVTVTFAKPPQPEPQPRSTPQKHPPSFVQPHPPYEVFSAPLYHARELTKPGAAKRTFHFDIDVTDYPIEGDVDFKVGGAVGVCPPNDAQAVEDIFDALGVPRYLRDKTVLVKTQHGRWPTIWGDEKARDLVTTRRDLLTWCSDIQSYPPTKPLLRVLAEYATDDNEKQILLFLVSAQGQSAFCDLRTGPHLSILHLLHAFPSAKPPLPALLAVLKQLMPRFYSLSNDPHVSSDREGLAGRRLIEIAVTVHDSPEWRGSMRKGVGSGFLERIAEQFIQAESRGTLTQEDLRIPMFRGLMANPLSKEFGASDGPMMLIGAGVGMAPFRGFILNRLRNANCASKIWLVQGVRDAKLDELYSGELGKYEAQIKRVVQSRAERRRLSSATKANSEIDLTTLKKLHWQKEDSAAADSRYVQDEVRQQADIVWNVINSVDGRVFVCGSSKGMGEGVEQALRDVAMLKGGFGQEGATKFWDEMKEAGRYIAETW